MRNLVFIFLAIFISLLGQAQEIQGLKYNINIGKSYFPNSNIDSISSQKKYYKRISRTPAYVNYFFTDSNRLEVYWLNETIISHMLLFQDNKRNSLYIDSNGKMTKRELSKKIDCIASEKKKDTSNNYSIDIYWTDLGETRLIYNDSISIE
ncbi:hypothetical protein OAX11_05245, partial [Flavobacteriaceae bacterium]|nr:hypothetical protein [Flavobacteriaceae bacterium]